MIIPDNVKRIELIPNIKKSLKIEPLLSKGTISFGLSTACIMPANVPISPIKPINVAAIEVL